MEGMISINKSDEIKSMLESNNIPDEEVIEVIRSAESDGIKFFEEGTNNFLGVKRISEITLYVEYSPVNDLTFDIHKVYWHKSLIDHSPERID